MGDGPPRAATATMHGATATQNQRDPVIIVGAGMAGLVCAVMLDQAGVAVRLFDASDRVGGRIRTDIDANGFLLDRGFQVILDAYPAGRRWLDLDALDGQAFDAGGQVWTGRRLVPLADPLRHPTALPRDLTSSLFPARDKLRLAALATRVRLAKWEAAADAAGSGADDTSAVDALRIVGFGDRFIQRFARPFWGGILLDPALNVSAGPLRFTLKMFLEGRAVLPAAGVRAVPEQLARRLPVDCVHCLQPVEAIVVRDGTATGVRLHGETVDASAVVVAADPPQARRLTGIETLPRSDEGVGSVTVYLTGARDPGVGKRLIVDATGHLLVNHVAPLSVVAPSYAPSRQHLLAAVVIGRGQESDDDTIAQHASRDVATMLGHDPTDWSVIAVSRIPFSQYAQPPGIYQRLPSALTTVSGLFLAGEATVDSSTNGAMLSGEVAARAVMSHRRRY